MDCYDCKYADKDQKTCHALPKIPIFIPFMQYSDEKKNGTKLVSLGQTGHGCKLFEIQVRK